MNTIEIILAVAISLVLLGTWDNSGRIDQLQRWRAAQGNKARASATEAKEREGKNPTAKNLLGIIENLETTIKAKDAKIKDLNGELNETKFEYAKQVAECSTEIPSLNELRLLTFGGIGSRRAGIRGKIKALGAKSLTTLDPTKYKEFRDYMLTIQIDR